MKMASVNSSLKNIFLALASATLLLSIGGCVMTRVSSGTVLRQPSARISSLVVKIEGARFTQSNIASSSVSSKWAELTPNLIARIPVIFEKSGIKAEAISFNGTISDSTLATNLGVMYLVVFPTDGYYSSRSGTSFGIKLSLVDPVKKAEIWTTTARMATMGFGKFDEKTADDLLAQVLTELKQANLTPN